MSIGLLRREILFSKFISKSFTLTKRFLHPIYKNVELMKLDVEMTVEMIARNDGADVGNELHHPAIVLVRSASFGTVRRLFPTFQFTIPLNRRNWVSK